METGHTPGPWHVNGIDSKRNRITGDETSEGWDKLHINGGNCTVARVYRSKDARLIAQAWTIPALRGALEDIAGELQTGVSATPGDTYTRRKVNVEKLIAKARKALAL